MSAITIYKAKNGYVIDPSDDPEGSDISKMYVFGEEALSAHTTDGARFLEFLKEQLSEPPQQQMDLVLDLKKVQEALSDFRAGIEVESPEEQPSGTEAQ